jgi:deoxyribodipyrimidine photolyase
MSKEALSEMLSTQKEITYQDYKTTNLHMCADASKQLKELMANSKLNPKFVLQAIQATDQYLGIEKAAMKNGYADQETVHNFIMKFAIAHDTLNMLGYPDKDLAYMEKHLTIMSNLSMHKDTNFANEIGSTINTYGAEDTSEGVDTSDYAIKIEAQGNNRKVHPARIITDKQVVKENRTMKPNYSNFRKKIQEIYEPDPPTHNRDINFSDIKDVFHGIDNPIHDETIDGKPVGLISFKTFMNEPMNKKLAVAHEKDRQDVHRDQLEFSSTRSPSYKMMKKVNQLEP